MWGAHSGHCIMLKSIMLKNAFKKHPLQNRTNVQIKGGGGGQRPFEQCSKKLHFSYRRASLRLIKCTSGAGGCDIVEDPRPWVCGVQTQLKEGVPSTPQAVSAIPFKPELVLDKNSTEIRKVSSICGEIEEKL